MRFPFGLFLPLLFANASSACGSCLLNSLVISNKTRTSQIYMDINFNPFLHCTKIILVWKKNIYIRDQVTDLFQHKYVIDIFIDKKEVRPEQFHTVQPYIKCKRKLFYQCLINVQILIKNRNYFFLIWKI